MATDKVKGMTHYQSKVCKSMKNQNGTGIKRFRYIRKMSTSNWDPNFLQYFPKFDLIRRRCKVQFIK